MSIRKVAPNNKNVPHLIERSIFDNVTVRWASTNSADFRSPGLDSGGCVKTGVEISVGGALSL
jgi:hypothetical protein